MFTRAGIYAAQPLDAFYSDESNYLDGVEWV